MVAAGAMNQPHTISTATARYPARNTGSQAIPRTGSSLGRAKRWSAAPCGRPINATRTANTPAVTPAMA